MKYVLAGLLPPLFWALVFWLTRRYCPYLMTPVGAAWRGRRLRRLQRQQAAAGTLHQPPG